MITAGKSISLDIIFVHLVAKHFRRQDTKTQT